MHTYIYIYRERERVLNTCLYFDEGRKREKVKRAFMGTADVS